MGWIELSATSFPPCSACGFVLRNEKGIWQMLSTERAERFRQFVREYECVRSQEGRGSLHPDFYLALPYQDLSGCNTWQWKIRARSFRYLEERILPELELSHSHGLDVLDIGAGNGWLSYRLALRGHRPVALDLLDNEMDGLGAASHYFPSLPEPFLRFRAEMDRLPFVARQFDLAIFNAAFHYSEDYERTLAETLRCSHRPGYFVILDSPFYYYAEAGQQMVKERRAAFEKKFGFRSDSVPSREYLTSEVLEKLARFGHFEWKL